MRNYDKDAIVKADTQHHFHPFTDHAALWRDKSLWTVVAAQGAYLTTIDGDKILDFMAGLWCVNVGYGRKEIAQAAFEQMNELPYYNSFFKSTTPPTAMLAEKLSELLGENLPYIFFGSSGSESNDTIVRAVRLYWQIKGHSEKRTIISRKNAYHGSTLAGASLGGMPLMHRQAGLEVKDITHIEQPYAYALAQDGEDLQAFGLRMAAELEKEILRLGADNVAAFIGEPIQGAGGVIIPPDSYWPQIQNICRKHNILLIADEVICGFGRTGKWFGHQTFGFNPDLVTMAKGISSGYLPLSAIAMSTEVANTIAHGGEEFAHGYTYSGHPTACRAALANLAILENENLIEHAQSEIAPRLATALEQIAQHPLVGEARSRGAIGAIELSPHKASKAPFENVGAAGAICRNHCLKNKIILRACRDSIVLCPPLTVGKNEIDEMNEKIHKVLDDTMEELGL